MNFRRHRLRDEPEINLIPLIDVLLVILIFLAASTSFSRFSQLSVTLPVSQTAAAPAADARLVVTVAADGRYALNGKALPYRDVSLLAQALAAAANGRDDPVLVIDADANAPHQTVTHAMEAAALAGIVRIGFTAQR